MLYSEQMKQICEKLGVNPEECKDGLYSTLLQTICDACDSGGGSGGGGAEFKTCTVRFVPYSYSDGWETFEAAKVYNNYGYTKCVDGVISAELVRGDAATTDFDITIENVLCGSLLFFSSNAEVVNTDDANGGGWDEIDPTHFFAPAEANVVCTIKLGVPGDGGW